MIRYDVVLEPIGPSLIAAHSGTDLLATDIVLDGFRPRAKALVQHRNQSGHCIAIIRFTRPSLALLLQSCCNVNQPRTVEVAVSYCPLLIPYSWDSFLRCLCSGLGPQRQGGKGDQLFALSSIDIARAILDMHPSSSIKWLVNTLLGNHSEACSRAIVVFFVVRSSHTSLPRYDVRSLSRQ